ncbi:MAG: hypothetical protein ACPG4T_02590 [Nannocystaceae bacterium]
MYDEVTSTADKLPLGPDGTAVVQRLARWIRIVGMIQLGFCCLLFALLFMSSGCGLMMGGFRGAGLTVLLLTLLPFAILAAYVLLSLRLLQAGDQLQNLAIEGDADFLEFAFARLKTVYTIEAIVGALMFINVLLEI